ncbi:MAG: hypothetical protein QNK03_22190 [Myxococcota bacterium]|nr:hypothetical protein [Myxococcota bacterium]
MSNGRSGVWDRLRGTRIEFKVVIAVGLAVLAAVAWSALAGDADAPRDLTGDTWPAFGSPRFLQIVIVGSSFLVAGVTFALALPIFLFSSDEGRSENAGELVKTTLAFFIGALTSVLG